MGEYKYFIINIFYKIGTRDLQFINVSFVRLA